MPSEEHPHRESFSAAPSFTLWTLLWVYPALIVSFTVWNLGLSNTLMLFNMTLHRLYTGRRLNIKYGPRLQDYSIQKTKILVSHLMLTSMDYTFSLQNWWPMGVQKNPKWLWWIHAISTRAIGGWDDWPTYWKCVQAMIPLRQRHGMSFTYFLNILQLIFCHSY